MTESPALELTTCKCCGQPLDTFQQFSSIQGTCRTLGCDRINITRELDALAALTEAEIERFHIATRKSDKLFVDLSAYL